MRFVLLSDVHLSSQNPVSRTDNIFEAGVKKLEFVYKYARKVGASVLQAGDFFDRPRDWHALSEMIRILRRYRDVTTYCVLGQHDMYYRQSSNSSTSIGVLEKAGLLCVLGVDRKKDTYYQHPEGFPTVEIYGAGWGQEVPKIDRKTAKFRILITHAPVSFDTDEFPDSIHAERVMKKYGDFDVILCGDIHRFFYLAKDNRVICNTGPLIRRDADHYSFDHAPSIFDLRITGYPSSLQSLIVPKYEIKSCTQIIVPHQDATKVLSRTHIDHATETRTMLDEFIKELSQVNSKTEIGLDIIESLSNWIKSQGKLNKKVSAILERIINE